MLKKWNEGWSGFLVAAALVAAAPLAGAQAAPLRVMTSEASNAATSDRAYLGVYVEGEADGGGVKLGEIVPGSPAEKAGLKDGDVVVALGDRTIGNETELRDAIAAFGVGSKVKITFLRDGEKRRTSARLAAAPGETEAEGDEEEEENEAAERAVAAPIELTPVDDAQAGENPGFLGVQLEAQEGGGAKVLEVIDGSPAEKAGIEAGDVIVKVDGTDVESAESLTSAIRSHHAGDAVKLTVDRNGERQKIKATLGTRNAMAMGGGAGVTAGPSGPAKQPVPTRAPAAARSAGPAPELQQMRRELEEMRRELQELRRRCEEQQKTLDSIRRALDGDRSPGSTSMAAPTGVGMPATFSLGAADGSGGLFAIDAPPGGLDLAPATLSLAAAPQVSTAGVAAGGGDDCCAATAAGGDACCGEAPAACTATASAGDEGASTMVWTLGEGGQVISSQGQPAIVVDGDGESGKHVFQVILGDDGTARFEAAAASPESGLYFFGKGEGSDDAKPAKAKAKAKSQGQRKAVTLKLGGKGGMVYELPSTDESTPGAIQFRGHATPHAQAHPPMAPAAPMAPMKVKGMKLAPKMKGLNGGEFEFHFEPAEGGESAVHPRVRVMRMPQGAGMGGMPGMPAMPGHGTIAVKPLRARVAPRLELRTQQGECNGSCAAHCPAKHLLALSAPHGSAHATAHGGTKVECAGACTIVIDGGCCELQCEGGEFTLADAAECTECDDDDDFGSADFQLMQVGEDDDDDSCCSSDEDDDDDSCCGDDDDDDDDSCCSDDDDDDEDDDGDINYL